MSDPSAPKMMTDPGNYMGPDPSVWGVGAPSGFAQMLGQQQGVQQAAQQAAQNVAAQKAIANSFHQQLQAAQEAKEVMEKKVAGRLDVSVETIGSRALKVTVTRKSDKKMDYESVSTRGWFGRKKSVRRLHKDVDRVVALILKKWDREERREREHSELQNLSKVLARVEEGSYQAVEVRD